LGTFNIAPAAIKQIQAFEPGSLGLGVSQSGEEEERALLPLPTSHSLFSPQAFLQ